MNFRITPFALSTFLVLTLVLASCEKSILGPLTLKLSTNSQVRVTTLAGLPNGSGSSTVNAIGTNARFAAPRNLALDDSGNLFVTTSGGNVIRKIQLSDLAVTTFAGSGTAGHLDATGAAATFSGAWGLAFSRPTATFYISERSSDALAKIRKMSTAGAVTSFASNYSNTLAGICVDSSENVYVCDSARNVIWKVASDGSASVFAGTLDSSGTSVNGTASGSTFDGPAAICASSNGILYVAEFSGHRIRKIQSGTVSTFAGSATTGALDGNGAAAQFEQPNGIVMDAAGNLYVTDYAKSTLRKIAPNGDVTTLAGIAGSVSSSDGWGTNAGFGRPEGLAINAAGDTLYLADSQAHNIRKIELYPVTTNN